MKTQLIWDETKRQSNITKHGLDFADAADVLNARYRLDMDIVRIISFRPASQKESEDYYEWIANTTH